MTPIRRARSAIVQGTAGKCQPRYRTLACRAPKVTVSTGHNAHERDVACFRFLGCPNVFQHGWSVRPSHVLSRLGSHSWRSAAFLRYDLSRLIFVPLIVFYAFEHPSTLFFTLCRPKSANPGALECITADLKPKASIYDRFPALHFAGK